MINTNYSLKPQSDKDLIKAFGSLYHANRVCGDDEVIQCFYVNNPQMVPNDFIKERVLEAWNTEKPVKTTGKPSIAAISRRLNWSWAFCKKMLIEYGMIEK